jgi:hypothetical protein
LAPHESPVDQALDRRTERQSHIAQRIVDLGRHLRIDDAYDDPILFQVFQLLDQHFLVDAFDAALQFRESQRPGIPGIATLVANLPEETVVIDTSNYYPFRDLAACDIWFRAAHRSGVRICCTSTAIP